MPLSCEAISKNTEIYLNILTQRTEEEHRGVIQVEFRVAVMDLEKWEPGPSRSLQTALIICQFLAVVGFLGCKMWGNCFKDSVVGS